MTWAFVLLMSISLVPRRECGTRCVFNKNEVKEPRKCENGNLGKWKEPKVGIENTGT